MSPIVSKGFRSKGLIFVVCVGLAGCASPGQRPAVAPPAPMSDHVTMAPIPNPPEHEKAKETPLVDHPAPTKHPSTTTATIRPMQATPTPSNPSKAAQLRAVGLEQLNRGAIHRAVALLKQANQLDPENALIRHDLDRALRISHAVEAK